MVENEAAGATNKCTMCGACCAIYAITFPDSEADAEKGGRVPMDMTVAGGPLKRTMKGTDKGHKRCVALKGNIGNRVCCMIYDRRPSPCREFRAAWQENMTNDQCNRARAIYGLSPFDFI